MLGLDFAAHTSIILRQRVGAVRCLRSACWGSKTPGFIIDDIMFDLLLDIIKEGSATPNRCCVNLMVYLSTYTSL